MVGPLQKELYFFVASLRALFITCYFYLNLSICYRSKIDSFSFSCNTSRFLFYRIKYFGTSAGQTPVLVKVEFLVCLNFSTIFYKVTYLIRSLCSQIKNCAKFNSFNLLCLCCSIFLSFTSLQPQ